MENDWVVFIKNSQVPTNKEKIKMTNFSDLTSILQKNSSECADNEACYLNVL